MATKLRVALIGNRAHQNVYGSLWANRQDAEIVALAEHHDAKGAALSEKYGLPCSADYDAVIERDDVDAVCICTDFYLKRRLVPKAVDCGKHVLVDKSLARTMAEAEEIAGTCDDAKVKILLAYPQRFHPGFRYLVEAIHSGDYARPVSYSHHSVRQFPDGDLMQYVSYPTPARVNGGGELMNLGSHPIDLMLWAFGAPKRVYAHFETAYWNAFYEPYGTEDVATLFCEYEGHTATIVTGRNKLKEERGPVNAIDLWCDGTWVRVDERGYTENGIPVDVPEERVKGTAAAVDHFVDCVRNDRTPISGIRDGLVATEVTTAGYQSAATGEFVSLPLADKRHPMIADDDQVVDGYLD